MLKITFLLLSCLFLVMGSRGWAQSYKVRYLVADSGTREALQENFPSRSEATDYLAALPQWLRGRGFLTASLDSVQLEADSAVVRLYFGAQYQWASIRVRPSDADLLERIRWPKSSFSRAPLDFPALQARQEQILDLLEEEGHPFARVYLDSISIQQDQVSALLVIDRGYAYKFDSLRVEGNARISREFLERYLQLPRGSLYNRKKLELVDKKIREIPYVEEQKPSALTFTATGAVLHLYLNARRSSQVNVLVGLLPNSDAAARRFRVTGEANVLLHNSLGGGETIGMNWQQLQLKSPRLDLVYRQPYLFRSPFDLNFNFDMFRKDSSFVNILMQLGTGYGTGGPRSAGIFFQRRQTIVNGMDTLTILQTRRLGALTDVRSSNLGVSYSYNNTNYRLNPQKGNEASLTVSAGTKKLKKNNQVLALKDPSDPSFSFDRLYDTVKLQTYQFRAQGAAAHYFRTGGQTTLKTGLHAGVFQSGNYFLNELFMIGGYKLLRGFTEESEFVSQYAVGTLEYRYLIGRNSHVFAFADGGWARSPLQARAAYTYIGSGLGLVFETKAGIFNLAWAVGKRSDARLNLRQSKIHFGFVNYF